MGVATAIAGAAVLGAGASMYASNKASKAQSRAARDAAAATSAAAQQSIDAQERMFERQVELQEPFREAGLTAQNRMMTLLGLEGGEAGAPDYGRYAKDFTMADFEADPGYGFRISEGMKALERSAAARGGLLSGATLKGIQRFGQDTASAEYLNAFNRYQTNRANQLNPLQSLYGSGQTSANALTSAAGQTGAGMGNTYMGMGAGLSNAAMAGGAARASGYTGMANALTSGLSTGANLYMQYPLYQAMGQYYGRPRGTVGGPGDTFQS
jgi:hypothetical protein